MKSLGIIDRFQYTNESVIKIVNLYEIKGKETYFEDLFKKDILSLKKSAIQNNVYEIAKFLEFNLSEKRISRFAKSPVIAQNNTEILFNNMIRVISRVFDSKYKLDLSINEIETLASMVMKGIDDVLYSSVLRPTFALNKVTKTLEDEDRIVSKKTLLKELIEKYLTLKNKRTYESILLNTCFFIDFLNLEIFEKHNKEIAIVLLFALLKDDFWGLMYSSFFHFLNFHKKEFELGILSAAYSWNSGYPVNDVLVNVLITIILECYQSIDEQSRSYLIEKGMSKSDNLIVTITSLERPFTKEEIRNMHPNVSVTTIDRTLKHLKNERIIIPLGKGRTSRWQVIKAEKKISPIPLSIL